MMTRATPGRIARLLRSVIGAAAVLVLASSTASASSFTMLDLQNDIRGQLYQLGAVLQQYNQTSSAPLSAQITDTAYPGRNGAFSFAQSTASGSYVSVAINEPGSGDSVPHADAMARTTVTFAPTFNGAADPIFFTGSRPAEGWSSDFGLRTNWTITDLTLNAPVASLGGFNGPFEGTFPLLYDSGTYSWDSSHTYQFTMLVHTGSNHSTDGGWISTTLFASPQSSTAVPEPASLLLAVAGLGALFGARRFY